MLKEKIIKAFVARESKNFYCCSFFKKSRSSNNFNEEKNNVKSSYPLHIHISVVYIVIILFLLCIVGVFNYREAKKNVLFTSLQVFMQLNEDINNSLGHIQNVATTTIAYLYKSPSIESREFADQMKLAPLMGAMLQLHPELSSVVIGYGNGDFFRFGRANSFSGHAHGPEASSVEYLIRSYDSATNIQRLICLDRIFNVVEQHEVPYEGYDPRRREWYRQAIATDKVISTKPYFFMTGGYLGKSVAQSSPGKDMVISAAFSLAGVDKLFDGVKSTDYSNLLIFDDEDNVLYYSKLDIAVKKTDIGEHALFTLSELDYPLGGNVKNAVAAALFDTPLTLEVDGEGFVYAVSKLMSSSVGGASYYVAISSPTSAILPNATDLIRRQGVFTLLALLVAVPVSWLFSRRLSKNLIELSHAAQDARNFSFSIKEPVRSTVSEFTELSMSIFYANRTLKRFLDINTTISMEKDYDKLLDIVLYETMGTVDAVVGILYLLSEDGERLTPAAAKYAFPAGVEVDAAAASGFLLSLSPLCIVEGDLAPYLAAAIKGESQITRLARERWPSSYLLDSFDDPQMQLLSAPLVYSDKVTGVLCLYRRNGGEEPNRDMLSFVGRLSGGAAVAIENHRLLRAQKGLFDAFIRLVAGAIDSKSHYTGGHCQRVPVIARMLAAAVNAADEGAFADFHIDGGGWEVLRVASWLHDCGKIITPEHVVDKATKLETVYNRIHEVRMRFEVLKRDAEIACCRSMLSGEDEKAAKDRLVAECLQLDDDFAFLAKCNIGDEAIGADDLKRLKRIASRTWLRTLSDRLGISEAEKKRKERNPQMAVPAVESVLADRPEHLITRDEGPQASVSGKFDFKIEIPKYKYNLGELANLSIAWGTLTEEERFEVNNHVVQTMLILSHLPFPEEYGDVVGIAGSHHERVDAGGYPRRIGKDEMCVEARIIAIADVFEALTAADRPYKKAKTLSESLGIMSRMASSGHLDPDLFALFIRSGAYRLYAEMYLEGRQIDAVNESEILT